MNEIKWVPEFCRCFSAAVLIILLAFAVVSLSGCSVLSPADRYLPGQQYGGDGAACMDGNCPVINQPKQWLKPCAP